MTSMKLIHYVDVHEYDLTANIFRLGNIIFAPSFSSFKNVSFDIIFFLFCSFFFLRIDVSFSLHVVCYFLGSIYYGK